MFLQFYSLREQPFGVTPDPRFFYPSGTHREALASLVYALESRLGFAALLAEPGMGKTMLLRTVVAEFREKADFAFLFDVHPGCTDLLPALLTDFELAAGSDPLERSVELKRMLVTKASEGRLVVAIVDEAQNLTPQALESLRLLSNFETDSTKLLQIVVAGQPRLREMLSRPELRQLRQRIPMGLWIAPLSARETASYIQHRLHMAGYTGAPFFTDDAVDLIASQSRGVPREINALCFHALSLGYALRKRIIDSRLMQEVLRDMDWDYHVEPAGKPSAGAALAAPAPITSVAHPAGPTATVIPAPPPAPVHVSPPPEVVDRCQLSPRPADPEDATYKRKLIAGICLVLAFLAAGALYFGSQRLRANQRQIRATPVVGADAAAQPTGVAVEGSIGRSEPKLAALPPMTGATRSGTTRRSTTGSYSPPYPNSERRYPPTTGAPRIPEKIATEPTPVVKVRALRSSPSGARRAASSFDLKQAPITRHGEPGAIGAGLPVSQQGPFPSMPQVSIAEPRLASPSEASQPSRLIYKVTPVYPPLAQRLSLEGSVFLAVRVGRDGQVLNVHTLSGNSILAQAATEAVYGWKYRAATVGGVPVESTAEVLIAFHLRAD